MNLIVLLAIVSFSGAIVSTPSEPAAGTFVLKLTVAAVSTIGIICWSRAKTERSALLVVSPLVAFITLAALSSFYHSSSLVFTLAALQPFLLGLLIYACVILSPAYRNGPDRRIRRLVYWVAGAQIVFVLIKLLVHGIDEKVLIGTMSHSAGQLGVLLPAIAIPLLVFMQRRGNVALTWFLIAALFAFGIINEKRSVIFILPVVLIASLLANSRLRFRGNTVGGILGFAGVLAFSAAGVLAGIAVIPSLSDATAGDGGVSLSYAVRYALDYVQMDYGGSLQGSYGQAIFDTNIQVGRGILWLQIIQWLKESSWTVCLFGSGFGRVTPSEWTQSGTDPLFDLIGTRGAISGAGITVLETGIVGLLLISVFFVYLFLVTVRSIRKCRSSTCMNWLRTAAIIQFVFWYDFYFYSTSLFRTLPLPFILFVIAASVTAANRLDRNTPLPPVATSAPIPVGNGSSASKRIS